MEMRSVVPRDRSSSSPSSSASLHGPGLAEPEGAGGPLRPRLTAASLPGCEGAAPAFGRPASESRKSPPYWLVEYRLRFTCDLDVLDERH